MPPCLTVLLSAFSVLSSSVVVFSEHQYAIGDDYTRHPCRRICHQGEQAHLCEYAFKVEWYTTMSRACFACPDNVDDCSLPGCAPGTAKVRPIITANRQFPGPTIEVCKGDRIRLAITNALQNGETTTIHFHGITQKKSPLMDGTPMISQCPIQPGTTFTLDFEADEAGTYFWHSSSGVQRGDGLAGAFIVRDANDPHVLLYDIDNHPPIILQDWFETDTAANIFATHFYAGADILSSKALLINGRTGATVTKFQLDPTRRHRFRAINNAFGECPMKIELQGHHLILIATDGRPIKPQPTRSLTIYPGERYDFVPFATSQELVFELVVTGLAKCSLATGRAVFNYIKDGPQLFNLQDFFPNIALADEVKSNRKIFLSPTVPIASNESDLLDSLRDNQTMLKRKPDVVTPIDLSFDAVKNDDRMWPWKIVKGKGPDNTPRMNEITFLTPPVPLMTQYEDVSSKMFCSVDRRHCSQSEYCPCIHITNFPLNSLVELILIANSKEPDAIFAVHLHGYKLYVTAMGQMTSTRRDLFDSYRNGTLVKKTNFALVKDTITVPSGGYVIARFIADSPGIWLLQSQTDYHRVMGMAMGIGVGTVRDLPRPPVDWPKCGNYLSSGNLKMATAKFVGLLLLISMANY